jgi:hypothetical protein
LTHQFRQQPKRTIGRIDIKEYVVLAEQSVDRCEQTMGELAEDFSLDRRQIAQGHAIDDGEMLMEKGPMAVHCDFMPFRVQTGS